MLEQPRSVKKQKTKKSAKRCQRGAGVKIVNTIQENILYSSIKWCEISFGPMEYLEMICEFITLYIKRSRIDRAAKLCGTGV